MAEINSPRWYRRFQKTAVALGIVVAAIGLGIQNTGIMYAGLLIFFHGLIATLILMVEERRTDREPRE